MIELNKKYVVDIAKRDSIRNYLFTLAGYSLQTYTHSLRTAHFSAVLSDLTRMTAKEKEQIVIGALLHDIGKCSIPNDILNKEEPLNEKEIQLIKTHPTVGGTLIDNSCPYEVKQIVLLHHERLDGSGYPFGYIRTQIPLYVQLVTVSDMYEALTIDRPYREALSHKDAIKTLEKDVESGKINEDYVSLLDYIIRLENQKNHVNRR